MLLSSCRMEHHVGPPAKTVYEPKLSVSLQVRGTSSCVSDVTYRAAQHTSVFRMRRETVQILYDEQHHLPNYLISKVIT